MNPAMTSGVTTEPAILAVGEHRYDKVFFMLDFRQQG